jgi:DNA-binding PadR family transcriptional regulator
LIIRLLVAMALSHAILALLTKSPASGYELAKKFNEDFGTFWKSSQQQVYRDLAKLEELGLVTYESVPREGHLEKKLYAIAEAGKGHLAAWIAKPSQPATVREDLIVKILAGYLVSPSILREELQRHRAIHTQALAKYQNFVDCFYSDPKSLPPEYKLRRLAIVRGIRYAKDWIEWCDEALELVDELEQNS